MKFCFGDIVVVEENQIGVVVKSWCKSLLGAEASHDVYVRTTGQIVNYQESQIQRYMVRHKYLDEQEVEWNNNAVYGR
jgi:hypothetical protein